MKIVLAFDSFKGSMTANEACRAAASGLARLASPPTVIYCPLSDGGEGFAETIRLATNGDIRTLEVTGPLFQPVRAAIVLLDDGATAVVESAQACGLTLVPSDQRAPGTTTTRGVGEMIAAAVRAGATEIIIGLGGSSTNDAGMGLLAALGWRFLDAAGHDLPPVGDSLGQVDSIIPATPPPVRIVAACDVTNPLYGPRGAACTFAAQKGASPAEVQMLDAGLRHFATVCAEHLGVDYSQHPGVGAAGGLGFALLAFLGAEFQNGAELAMRLTGLARHLHGADLCLTGEGQTDYQTGYGKLPASVAACCTAAGVPCVCLSGTLGEGWHDLYRSGFRAILSISPGPQSLDTALATAEPALADAAEAIGRLIGE